MYIFPEMRVFDLFYLAMNMNMTVNTYNSFGVEIEPNSPVVFITREVYLYQTHTKYSNSLRESGS